MKKAIIFTFFIGALIITSFAQKIGYVNSKDVMSKMNEYNVAQKEINSVSEKWQQELEKQYKVIEEKYRDYQANEVIMPEDVRKERQEEIKSRISRRAGSGRQR